MEEKTIEETLKKISEYLQKNWKYEIIVIDNGSKDITSKALENYKKRNSSIFLVFSAVLILKIR
ncbi:hypothetical protein ES705_38368 [subsurface metagenome]